MWRNIRRSLVTAVAASLGLTGLSYAATGSFNPLSIVTASHHQQVGGSAADPTETPDLKDVDQHATDTEGSGDAGEHSKGPERSTTDCPDGFDGNHGQFVASSTEVPKSDAAHSDCGKPVQSTDKTNKGKDGKGNDQKESPDPNDHSGSHDNGNSGQHPSGDHGNGHGSGKD